MKAHRINRVVIKWAQTLFPQVKGHSYQLPPCQLFFLSPFCVYVDTLKRNRQSLLNPGHPVLVQVTSDGSADGG